MIYRFVLIVASELVAEDAGCFCIGNEVAVDANVNLLSRLASLAIYVREECCLVVRVNEPLLNVASLVGIDCGLGGYSC